jgi:hypothetical protein
MMQTEYTHISVILDRTGSMESIRDDIIGGFNAFLEEQRALPGQATLTLVQFDSQDPYEVLLHFAPIQQAAKLTQASYVPRASTPLLDALGRGINDLEQSLLALPEEERPGKVVMLVVTDGQENASREFTKAQIVRMVEAKRGQGWEFVFLSADLEAIREVEAAGVVAANTLAFDKHAQGTRAAMSSTSRKLAQYRAQQAQGMAFDEEDRRQQQSEQQRKRQDR